MLYGVGFPNTCDNHNDSRSFTIYILLTLTCVESKHDFMNMSTTIWQLTCVYPRFTKREGLPPRLYSHSDTPCISAIAHTNAIMRTTTIVILVSRGCF